MNLINEFPILISKKYFYLSNIYFYYIINFLSELNYFEIIHSNFFEINIIFFNKLLMFLIIFFCIFKLTNLFLKPTIYQKYFMLYLFSI
jgi:hypothetical protein